MGKVRPPFAVTAFGLASIAFSFGVLLWVYRTGTPRRLWFSPMVLRDLLMWVFLYLWLDKGKVFDDYLSKFYPPDQFISVKIGWNSRVISLLNASIVTFAGSAAIVMWPEKVFDDPIASYPWILVPLGSYFFAYCIFDLILILYNFEELGDSLIIIHHSVILLWLTNSSVFWVNYGIGGYFMANELSTIFLNFRWFFHKITSSPNGKPDSISPFLVQLNLFLFVFSFFVTRVVGNIYMTYKTLSQAFFILEPHSVFFHKFDGPLFTYSEVETNVKMWIGILVPFLCVLNIWWFFEILKKAWELFFGEDLGGKEKPTGVGKGVRPQVSKKQVIY
eukprot:TRINITY_DN4535_c0_g1_i4.p1 TRINITY_DN4535_c0_g1~~TRINITY_DN4535_c0_g1_i4.p1  ORF type:complete len:333 (-),score=56.86 TRINITY_DN4535_c0_g1_i4:630-1628(-)